MKSPPSPEIVEEILFEFKRLRGSPFKVAKAVGVDVQTVWSVIEDNQDKLAHRSERYGGLGRPELQQFIVARRHVQNREWDNNDPAIAKARDDYEAGAIEMCTGRDGMWLILYAIPRRKIDPRPGYFLPEW